MPKRNYRREYTTYHAVGPHRVGHALRLRARKAAEKQGLVRPHDGVELHHMNVDPTVNTPDNWVFMDRCTHQLVHGQSCADHQAAAPAVVYAHPKAWISRGAHTDMLRLDDAPAAAAPRPRAPTPAVPRGQRVFADRLAYVLDRCRDTGTCPEGGPAPQGPHAPAYRAKGTQARRRIQEHGGPGAYLERASLHRRVADRAAGRVADRVRRVDAGRGTDTGRRADGRTKSRRGSRTSARAKSRRVK